ncbi:curli-like amyloid fiber formation chaperone CsgH [Kaistella sp.]|uniref:curli-like amyloid fiber formation chaperone CsgH n=1 Tax=Kaistella sp. TaxID=2782235 RepID=UPI003C3C8DC3
MKTLIAILVMFSLVSKISAQKNSGVAGKIITNNNDGLLKINAVVINNSNIFHDLNYILVSVKKGKSGNSSNKQSGKFSIQPNETKTLSEVNINLAGNDALKIYLFLKDEETDRLVSKDSLEINPKNFNTDVTYIPDGNIELTGLTIDDTKTRIGQLFYDSFFKKYNQIPKKNDGTVIISELPTFGRSSRIFVSIDDQIIYSFISKPDEESLEAEANIALDNLADYISQNSLRNKEFKY